MKTKTHFRQGDVLLIAIKSIPSTATKLPPARSIVLAVGEGGPGHRHEIIEIDKVEAYKLAEGLYLDVKVATQLIHPEHEQIALLPGSYQIIRQSEYFRKELVRVTD